MLKADSTQRKKQKTPAPRGGRAKSETSVEVLDYRHQNEKRKNNPDAGLASYNYKPQQKVQYSYDPHLDPQLLWAGKAERTRFEVETVSLHIHERISTRAILKSVQRAQQWRQERLFAEPELPLNKRIEFYQHEMEWANRLILGDSLLVMNSLLERELMAGKVQMIYVDPPYGIKYASNFQPRINKRDVKDADEDLTREPEQIKAYRDTWQLGIHSWLAYLRDRLLLCRELLHESGSIFVQINDTNLHLVRNLLDEVFGRENFCQVIVVRKTSPPTDLLLPGVSDYLVWYARDKTKTKYRQLYLSKGLKGEGSSQYIMVELPDGREQRMTREERETTASLPKGSRPFAASDLSSSHEYSRGKENVEFRGRVFSPGGRYWSTSPEGMARLRAAERLVVVGNTLFYKRYLDDFPAFPLSNLWSDTSSSFAERLYSVQTVTRIIERCMLMTTDPGDLVFDPTCGSGTTAFCAEKWGRRWITCDTSRVALALARQRLMTARFDYYELADPEHGPSAGFLCENLPHVTMECIVHNHEIDGITNNYQSQLDATLQELNLTLGKRWKEWEVPLEEDAKWPDKAKKAHQQFWTLKRQRRKEIDDSIGRNAQRQLLYDRPHIKRDAVRVSGPFTVEAIPMPVVEEAAHHPTAGADHVNRMIELLQKSGVIFPGGRKMLLENLRPISSAGFLHAEGQTKQNGENIRVAISFGPRYGPVTARQVDEAIRSSYRLGFDVLVLAGMVFDPEAQATLQKNPIPRLEVHLANISPDVVVGEYGEQPLLRTTKASQLFTVFGQPDVTVEKTAEGFVVKLLGVDIYDPETGEVHSSSADAVPAWFLDEDYDGYTFRISQAFFPKGGTAKNAWDKLEKALHGTLDKVKMEVFRGTESLPFRAGPEKRIAVKLIDNRGNEVMVVKSLGNRKE